MKYPCPQFILPCPKDEKERVNIPRKRRQKSSTSIYHVMARGLNKLPVFEETRERTRMLNLIRENIENFDVEIYAYCIMHNHLHLLIKADLEELASFMAKILAGFAKYYNHKHNRVGYVFQGRYKSQCIEDIGYFWNCLRYIHNNPSHIEQGGNIVDYKYSSMKEIYYDKKDILAEIVFLLVAERFHDKEDFLEFHSLESWITFEDVVEEARENHLKIARKLLEQYKNKYKTTGIEIIDYIKTRKKYKQELAELLSLSLREVDKLVTILRDEMNGTG